MKQEILVPKKSQAILEIEKKELALDKVCLDYEQTLGKINDSNSKFSVQKKEINSNLKDQTNNVQTKNITKTELTNEHKNEIKKLNSEMIEITNEMNSKFAEINADKKSAKKDLKATLSELKENIKIIKSNISYEIKEMLTSDKFLKITDSKKKVAEKRKIKSEIKAKYSTDLNKYKNEYSTLTQNVGGFTITLIFLFSSLAVIITALTINYTVYYPSIEGQPYPWTDKNSIIAVCIVVLLLLCAGGLGFLLLKDSVKKLPLERKNSSLKKGLIIGFFTDFFDTIGIGSFAPTIVFIKAIKANDDDKKLAGILNVGHTLPVIFEAVIFIAAVAVDPATLIVLISMSVIGSYIGATMVNMVNKYMIKLFMGIVLFATAIMMILSHPYVQAFGQGGTATGLPFDDWKIYVSALIFLLLGALMSFGVGLYAPAMAVVTLMGMDVTTAFPIMMGSTAFLMPAGSVRFIQDKNYAPKLAVGISIGGVVGVIVAFLLIFVGLQVGLGLDKTTFVNYLLFLVIVVIFYASFTMLWEYKKFMNSKKIPNNVTLNDTA